MKPITSFIRYLKTRGKIQDIHNNFILQKTEGTITTFQVITEINFIPNNPKKTVEIFYTARKKGEEKQ